MNRTMHRRQPRRERSCRPAPIDRVSPAGLRPIRPVGGELLSPMRLAFLAAMARGKK